MTAIQSLKDLKEENAEAPEAESIEPQEVEEVEEVEAAETELEELEGDAETPEGEAEEVEVEAWQVEEEEQKTVPLSALTKVRSNLKEKLRDTKGENEELRKELDALKAQVAPQPKVTAVMPKLEDFDFDEGKYQQAMANYQSQLVLSQISQERQQQEAAAAAAKKQKEIQRKTDAHYERAQSLVNKHGINPEIYGQSDRNVREAIDKVMPNQGDSVADLIISTLGEGSEKVMYAIGRSESELSKLQTELLNDPTGLTLVAYLGQKKAEFTMPAEKKSQAPKPSRNVQGEVVKGSPNYERRYKDAQKKGDSSAAFKARIAARREGIDTRDW